MDEDDVSTGICIKHDCPPSYFVEFGECTIVSTLAFPGCLKIWNELQLSSAVQVYVESSDQWFTV